MGNTFLKKIQIKRMGTKFRDEDVEDSKNEKYAIKTKGMKMNDRSCTDVLCCLVFVIFTVSCIGITGMSVTQGDPSKIMTPFDSDGNQCGLPDQGRTNTTNDAGETVSFVRDFSEYPYKYFTDLATEAASTVLAGGATTTTDVAYNAVCVKVCPSGPKIGETKLDFIGNEEYATGKDVYASYNSTAFMGYCVPQVVKSL